MQDVSVSLNTEALLKAEVAELWGSGEAAQIWEGDGEAGRVSPLQRYASRMLANGQAALCLSGGGIRSAAFALGVVQALSRKGLLPHFQYLSTVSGGGYLGAFLSRWIAEETERLVAQEEERCKLPPEQSLPADREAAAARPALANVQRALANGGEIAGLEPAPIRWLRENSNFITPRVGVASADTWTAVATSFRNIAINWLVFAPALLLVVACPLLAAALLAAAGGWSADVYLIAGVILLAIAAWAGARVLPSHVAVDERWEESRIYTVIVLPSAVGAAVLSA
ncbi:MAG TPA: patatin-like phospholipase family protein, partial [Microvirga sp.]|nr:patatin-like phospholipase family protein [Microvirga sp.]